MVWRDHRSNWEYCTRCPLGAAARNHVLGRGHIPATLLLLGEAPGLTEDVYGKPFWGPAGDVLAEILRRAALTGTHFISNVLACIPRDDGRHGFREPTTEEALACAPRLLELVELVRPRGIVLLGQVAKRHGPKGATVKRIRKLYLPHPAWIARIEDLLETEYELDRCAEALRKFERAVMVAPTKAVRREPQQELFR